MSGPYNRGPYNSGPFSTKASNEAGTVIVTDPYFANVVLLLRGAGANNSTSFIDSSSYARTMTPVQQAKISIDAAKFGTTSMKFDGTLDSITTPFATELWMGNADFTWETFVYVLGYNGNGSRLWAVTTGDAYSDIDIVITSTGYLQVVATTIAGSWNLFVNSAIGFLAINTWHHIAVVRTGGTFYAYINGTRITLTTTAGAATLLNAGLNRSIGAQQAGADRALNGFLQEYRITKGVARYISATITVPTEIFPLGAGVVVDPHFAKVSLLAHINGVDNSTTFIDNSFLAATMTAVGNAKISTAQSLYGGSSALFDGSGDYVSVPDSEAFYLGGGDFTIEISSYCTYALSSGNYPTLISQWGTPYSFILAIFNTNKFYFQLGSSPTLLTLISTDSYIPNQWQKVVIVRQGSIFTMWVDGSLQACGNYAGIIPNSPAPLLIGHQYDAVVLNSQVWCWKGYLDEVRITKGVARYSTASIPAVTAEFPNS